MVQQASIKPATVTKEALTFPIDYNDVTAVDPPAKAVFCTQASITQFLAAKGTSNFKHLNAVLEAIPITIQHNVTVNLAAGIHRPRAVEPAGTAWSLPHKNFVSPDNGYITLTIAGPLPSTWMPFDPSLVTLAIVGVSAPNSGDPWIDVSGTPFMGFDLRGSFVIFDTGQVVMIHKHTTSRLFLTADAGPTPTSITKIARPSAIYRNSLDDVAMLYPVCGTSSLSGALEGNGYVQIQDLIVQPCGAYNFSVSGFWWWLRTIYDQRAPIVGYTNCISAYLVAALYFENSSLLGGPAGLGLWASGSNAFVQVIASYLSGPSYCLWGTSAGQIGVSGSVIDDCGTACLVSEGGYFYADNFNTTLKYNEIRASRAVGLDLGSQSKTRYDYQAAVSFSNHVGVPAVRVGPSACLIQSDGTSTGDGLRDGGGNTDVGIEMVGPCASAVFDNNNNVEGTLGAVRMSDGEIWSWSDLKALGPIEDTDNNIVRKS